MIPSVWTPGAADWAHVQEPLFEPAYRAVLDELGPWTGVRLLDIGCGAGGFAALARAHGAAVAGMDESPAMVGLAQHRLPDAEVHVADMHHLPWVDARFHVTTGFNSFQFADDPTQALAEARRVTHPGGRVVAGILGTRTECQTAAYLTALRASLPPLPAAGPDPFALSEPGLLERLMQRVGLAVGQRRVVACPWRYANLETALRGVRSGGPATQAINRFGAHAVTEAASRALAPFRRPDGSYLLDNTVHYIVATVPGHRT